MIQKVANCILLLLALILLTGCGARIQGGTPEEAAQTEEGQNAQGQETVGDETGNGESAVFDSADAEEITMARLVEANRAAALLEKYGSLRQTVTTEYGPDTSFWSAYTENDMVYEQYAENPANAETDQAAAYLSTEKGDAYYFITDDGMMFSVCLYALPEVERNRMAPAEYEPLDPVMTAQETISAVSEEADGTVRIDTQFAASTISYIADADTLELRSMVEMGYPVVDEPDGDMDEPDEIPPLTGMPVTIRTTVEPGAARPALAAEMLDLLDGALSAEDTRTVTIIADPGQDEEEVYSLTLKKGVNVFPVLGENYTLCQQTEAGMIPFVFADDWDSDQTLYAIADYANADYAGAENAA